MNKTKTKTQVIITQFTQVYIPQSKKTTRLTYLQLLIYFLKTPIIAGLSKDICISMKKQKYS